MINNGWGQRIKKTGFKGGIRQGVPMSEITSFRIGGPADVLLYPEGLEDLQIVIALCREEGVSYPPSVTEPISWPRTEAYASR
jgi:hypothetical protein